MICLALGVVAYVRADLVFTVRSRRVKIAAPWWSRC